MKQFEPFDFYILRMPVLPYGRILDMHKHFTCETAFKAEIKSIFSAAAFQEAIFLASPELYEEMLKWIAQDNYPKSQKVFSTLYKYLVRMSTRSTPYGTFAGCAVGAISKSCTNINISQMSFEKVSRIDMGYFSALAEALPFLDENLLGQTKFYSNTSIYCIGNTYRYYEYTKINGTRKYYLSSFAKNKYIEAILKKASKGVTLNSILGFLKTEAIKESEANNYVASLIKNQVLISEFSPKLTSGNQLAGLIDILKNKNLADSCVVKDLGQLDSLLKNQDTGITKYKTIKNTLQKIIPTINDKDYIQTDIIYKPSDASIHQSVFNQIAANIQQLAVFNDPIAPHSDLEIFKRDFFSRFENQEVPLMHALDADFGIGYGIVTGENASHTPLIDDLIIAGNEQQSKTSWTAYHSFILSKLIAFQKGNGNYIEITDEEIKMLSDEKLGVQRKLPSSFSIMGSLFSDSCKLLDDGHWSFLLKACGGTNSLALLGRFAADNDGIKKAIQPCATHEKDSHNSILAEIVHFPEGRLGNILLRPQIYDHEISFLGTPSVNDKSTIPVNDIYVSIKNNRIVLRSKKLKREIIPRLTSAHNFSYGLPIYKFLCEIQAQDEGFSIAWDWGVLNKEPFLPRIVYKNIILKQARWLIKKTDFEVACICRSANEALFFLKEKYRIPDIVLLSEGDNELLFDFSIPTATAIFFSKIKKGPVVLYEFLYDGKRNFLANENGLFANEIIFQVKNNQYTSPQATVATSHKGKATAFTLGSEWVYAKIYTGFKWADTILLKEILPLVDKLKKTKKITSWFFIRYKDPGNHLRIRFKSTGSAQTNGFIINKLNKICATYIANGIIQKLEYGTYAQEVEKYGITTMELSESIFCIDSDFVLALLSDIEINKQESDRFLFALKGIDTFLNGFNFSLKDKLCFSQTRQLDFFKEFNGDKNLTVQLNDKYRADKDRINSILSLGENFFSAEINTAFDTRCFANKMIAAKIIEETKAKKNNPDILNNLILNYIHLFINRLFVANQRLHELVLYHYMMKFYESETAKEKYPSIHVKA